MHKTVCAAMLVIAAVAAAHAQSSGVESKEAAS